MTPEAFDAAARRLPGVTMEVLWGVDEVYKVGGRMFAITGPSRALAIKVTEIAFEALIETGRAKPSPYLARAHWLRFEDLGALDDAEVIDWLGTAHALVAEKLTRKARKEIGLI